MDVCCIAVTFRCLLAVSGSALFPSPHPPWNYHFTADFELAPTKRLFQICDNLSFSCSRSPDCHIADTILTWRLAGRGVGNPGKADSLPDDEVCCDMVGPLGGGFATGGLPRPPITVWCLSLGV